MTVIAEVIDPDDRRVELTVERWSHIVDEPGGHPELADYHSAVLDVIRSPDVIRPGRVPNERWNFLRGVGSSRWLQVFVVMRGTAAGSSPRSAADETREHSDR